MLGSIDRSIILAQFGLDKERTLADIMEILSV